MDNKKNQNLEVDAEIDEFNIDDILDEFHEENGDNKGIDTSDLDTKLSKLDEELHLGINHMPKIEPLNVRSAPKNPQPQNKSSVEEIREFVQDEEQNQNASKTETSPRERLSYDEDHDDFVTVGLDEEYEEGIDFDLMSDEELYKKKTFRSELFDWGEALVIALSAVIVIFLFFVDLVSVDGSSMFPTLNDQDKLISSNLFYTPTYGDIVILTPETFIPGEYQEGTDPNKSSPIVKRVIATEGQTVDIDFELGEVYVDGIKLDEPYINEPTYTEGDISFPQVVPEGCIFVLGDNRNRSQDSRFSDIGMVDTRYLLGRVVFRFYPFEILGTVE